MQRCLSNNSNNNNKWAKEASEATQNSRHTLTQKRLKTLTPYTLYIPRYIPINPLVLCQLEILSAKKENKHVAETFSKLSRAEIWEISLKKKKWSEAKKARRVLISQSAVCSLLSDDILYYLSASRRCMLSTCWAKIKFLMKCAKFSRASKTTVAQGEKREKKTVSLTDFFDLIKTFFELKVLENAAGYCLCPYPRHYQHFFQLLKLHCDFWKTVLSVLKQGT